MFNLNHLQRRIFASLSLSLALLIVAGCNRDPNVRKQKYLESGQRYEKEGKLREAGIQFSNALKIDHNFGDAHYELAKVYLQMGAIQSAYNEYSRTVDLSPSNVQARLDLGNLSLAGGRADLAEQQAKAILTLQPSNADAYALLASISAHNRDAIEAEKQIRRAISIDPNRAVFHTTLGLLLGTDPARQAESEQELQKSLQLDNKDLIAHLALAAINEKRSDFDAAKAQLLTAVNVAPKNLQARETLAGFYFRRGDTADAEQTIRQATTDFADVEQGAELLADYYIRTGQLDKAESSYAQLVSDHPKSFQLNYEYARILVLRHEDTKVPAVAAVLKKLGPNSPQTKIVESSLLVDAGKTGEAVDALKKAVSDAPDNFQLHLALAKVAMAKGDVDLASTNFNDAARINARSIDAQAGIAQVAEKKGDFTTLLQSAQTVITLQPSYGPAYLWRASGEATQKQYEQAEADIEMALQKQPDDPQAYVLQGEVRAAQGHLPDAIESEQKALTLDPNSVSALGQLVNLYGAQKQPEKAIPAVQAQIAKSPGTVEFYIFLAALQNAHNDPQDALAAGQKALQLNPQSEEALGICADSQARLGHVDQALNLWTNWIAGHPNDANATSMAGQLEDQLGDKAKAMQYYQRSLQIDPNQFWALNNLAYIMLDQHQNLDVALAYAQQARTARPHLASTADTLAWVYYYKGMYGSSRDLLEDAVKTDPDDADIQYHLGMAYSKLGDRTNAAIHLKKAVTLAGAAKNSATEKNAQTALAQL